MDRNVNNSGFSFIEIIIAMIVIGVVALLVGLTMTYSLKFHKKALYSDEARAIAKEKLSSFQDTSVTIPITGSEVVVRNTVSYNLNWAITQVSNVPDLVTITVKWDNNTKDVTVSGYIEAKLLPCPAGIHNPINISLSATQVSLSAAIGTEIGMLSTTDPQSASGDCFTYVFETGTGSADNAKFGINGDKLVTAAGMTLGLKSVRIKSTDCNGASTPKAFSIIVNDGPINHPPVNITLMPATINENLPSNTFIGALVTSDPDVGQVFTYLLIAGDVGDFQISGTNLISAVQYNFEVKNSYSVTIQTTDDGSPAMSFSKTFTIAILDLNDAPSDIIPSTIVVNENAGGNFTLANLTTVDDEIASQVYTYSLVAGDGSTDNDSFNILIDALRATNTFNYETQPKHTFYFRIRTTDNGLPILMFEKKCEVTVNNVNETPVINPRLADFTINVGQLLNFTVTTTDPDGDVITYSDIRRPASASFNTASGNFSWTPTAGGFDTLWFKASDPGGLFDRDTIGIEVIGAIIDTLTLTLRGLHLNNGTSTGDNTNFFAGKYLRGPTINYSEETSCYKSIAYLAGKTIDTAIFRFSISSFNGVASGKTIKVFEQNHAAYSPTAIFSTYGTAVWANSLGSAVVSATGTKYLIGGAPIKTLVKAWVAGSKVNRGFIMGSEMSYYTYFYTVASPVQLIVKYH
jgi:prepilin-type N-terminal cleavage/methylation domain-containing protein